MDDGVSYPPVTISGLLSDVAPVAESVSGVAGTAAKATREGHQHPRLTSTSMAAIVTGSTVTVNFTRTFSQKPGMVMTEIEGDASANSQPAIFKVQSWVTDGNGNYTGAVIKAWRAQTIPQNLATLLLGGIFNLFNSSPVGTQFSCIAIARSDV